MGVDSESFWVVDVEGSGGSPPEIVELAIIQTENLTLTANKRQWFVRPERGVHPAATRIHGLTDDDVADAPSIEDIADDVIAWSGDVPIAGHNVRLEVDILARSIPGWNVKVAIDTLKLATPKAWSCFVRPGQPWRGIRPGGRSRLVDRREAPLGALRRHSHSSSADPPAFASRRGAAAGCSCGGGHPEPETRIILVISRPIKVAVTGTHSSGKTTFLERLTQEIGRPELKIRRIGDFARRAGGLGFPILREHNYDSTLWIIAECMRCEAEAALDSDVILVDRPVVDALGYLQAALELSGRTLDRRRLDALATIVRAHTPEYDVLIMTALDKDIALGEGRDTDAEFREAAAIAIESLLSDMAPVALVLRQGNRDAIARNVAEQVLSSLSAAGLT